MKVRDRIGVITDLLLGAVYADGQFLASEQQAVRRMLCDLTVRPTLEPEVEARIMLFDPRAFDISASAQDFVADPPMNKRRLLELVAQLCLADGEMDLAEDDYLHSLANALGMRPTEYQDIVLDYEIHTLRESFQLIRMSRVSDFQVSTAP